MGAGLKAEQARKAIKIPIWLFFGFVCGGRLSCLDCAASRTREHATNH